MFNLHDTCERLGRNEASLTMLNLQHKNIGSSGVQKISASLRNNTHLVVLFLEDNDISATGAKALASALPESSLQYLYLSYNSIGDEGACALATALKHSRLKVLKMADNNIGKRGAQALAQGLAENSSLTSLVLDSNVMKEDGLAMIADGLRSNTSLSSLDLRYNGVTDFAAVNQAFLGALQNGNKMLKELLLLDPSADDCEKKDEATDRLSYFLELNRLGRHSHGSMDKALWPRVIASASDCDKSTRLVFALMRDNPDMICKDDMKES